MLKASRGLRREGPLAQTAGERRDDLGHRQIGHEDIVPALHDLIELVAAWLRQVELEQGAGVAIEGAGQPRSVCRPPLEKPRRNAPPSRLLKNPQAAQKGPDARRRPTAAREAYFLYVERAVEGANEAEGRFSAAC